MILNRSPCYGEKYLKNKSLFSIEIRAKEVIIDGSK